MGLLRGFSVAAVMKRMCKAALKKGLGDLFLGDLDLDRLDLQLTRGTVELTDLALNADFINAQLSRSPFMVKEGSIKFLLVKFPLQLKSCEIVVEGLELVLAPSVASEFPPVDPECSVSGSSSSSSDTQAPVNTKRNESDSKHCSTSASRDVDEGVKRIANAVKWFLTNFKIKFKNTYVVFDPQTILDDKISEFNRSLVFRVKELEFGTNLSTDGLVKLNNFVTFHEAVIEFLEMDDVDVLLQTDLGRATSDISSGHSTTAVLTGPIGGFSGTLNLSIPWSNGCLNLKKIDADVSVDSLELLLRISSIQWFMYVLDSFQRNRGGHNFAHNTADMSLNTSRSALGASKSVVSGSGDSDQISLSQSRQDKYQDSFLTKAHVVQDWIPELVVHEDQGEPDSDCDGSIDQFFECFEELRNSQTNLGNSAIWDWTCSVFNAITFASTLASGSDQVPKEPPIEKTLRASVTEISVILLLNDEMDAGDSSVSASIFSDMRNSKMFSSCLSSGQFEQSMMSPATASSLNIHHLEARFQNIHLELETYPSNLGVKASISHMKVDEYYSTEKHNSNHSHLGTAFLNNNFCREVQAALLQFPFSAQDCWVETTGHFSHNSDKFIKVELLKTFGECTFHYDVRSTDQDGNSGSSISLSIHLAPLILWVHFHTVYMIVNFISKVESDVFHGKHKVYKAGDEKNSKLTNTSSSESLNVHIAPLKEHAL